MNRRLGCVAWTLLIFGLILFFRHYWEISTGTIMTMTGIGLGIAAFTYRNGKGYLFPGFILFIMGSALLFKRYDIIDYDLWRLLPVLLGSVGLALLLMWSINNSGWWVFVPAGILIIACGVGLNTTSWWTYQRWFSAVLKIWHLFVVAIGLALVVGYWRSHAEEVVRE